MVRQHTRRVRTVPMDKPVAGYFKEMHLLAARELGLPYPHGEGTVAVLSTLRGEERAWHEEHGRRELLHMRAGMPYREAHARTLLEMGDYRTEGAAARDAERMERIAKEWRRKRRGRV